MECKDISEADVIEAIELAKQITLSTSATRWEIGAILSGQPQLVGTLMFEWDMSLLLPERLVLAKLRKMVHRGILDGCYCGCRGNFDVKAEAIIGRGSDESSTSVIFSKEQT